jgi:hypothetical protein
MLIGGQSAATVQPVRNCVVSPNIATSGLKLDGPVYVWITKDSKPIAADVNSRDLSNLVAGPALFFLDNPERRNQILTAPLNIQVRCLSGRRPIADVDGQALGSANLGINQFGDAISLAGGRNQQGQKGSVRRLLPSQTELTCGCSSNSQASSRNRTSSTRRTGRRSRTTWARRRSAGRSARPWPASVAIGLRPSISRPSCLRIALGLCPLLRPH